MDFNERINSIKNYKDNLEAKETSKESKSVQPTIKTYTSEQKEAFLDYIDEQSKQALDALKNIADLDYDSLSEESSYILDQVLVIIKSKNNVIEMLNAIIQDKGGI